MFLSSYKKSCEKKIVGFGRRGRGHRKVGGETTVARWGAGLPKARGPRARRIEASRRRISARGSDATPLDERRRGRGKSSGEENGRSRSRNILLSFYSYSGHNLSLTLSLSLALSRAPIWCVCTILVDQARVDEFARAIQRKSMCDPPRT